MNSDAEVDLLVRLARALGDAAEHAVVIGGAAQRLYRSVELPMRREVRLLRTFDTDVALTSSAPKDGRLEDRLRAEGLNPELRGHDTPPVTYYRLETSPMHYLQFVTHRHGADSGPSTAIVAGIVAERLRHVDLLTTRPWLVELKPGLGFPSSDPLLSLRVANAAAYMAQKLLIRRRRDAESRAKDVAYLHDTLNVFAPSLDALASEWRLCCQHHAKWRDDVLFDMNKLVGGMNDDVRGASVILQSAHGTLAPADASGLLENLSVGLARVFDS